jgi:hypothetical protein
MEQNVNEPCDKGKALKGEARRAAHSAPWVDTEGSIGDSAHELDDGPKGSKESSFSGE